VARRLHGGLMLRRPIGGLLGPRRGCLSWLEAPDLGLFMAVLGLGERVLNLQMNGDGG